MEKTITIDLNDICEVKDIAELIINMDEKQQSELIRRLAKEHHNNHGRFCMQLQFVSDNIKECYSHDTQDAINGMIKTFNEYLGEKWTLEI